MSARQRHSRITTPDGWTTISTSKSRKSNNQNGNNKKKNRNKKQDATGKEEEGGVVSKKEHSSGAISALLAHKSDLDFQGDDGGEGIKGGTIDEAELEKVRIRVEKQIAGFMASECCRKLTEMVRREFGDLPVEQDSDGKDIDANGKQDGIKNVLILALGSLSETFKAAPGYQLAAILSIIDVLKESTSASKKPTDTEASEKREDIDLNIISYDPIYTPIDIHLLSTYNVTTIPAAQIPTDSTNQDKLDGSWYENAVVYMPHASVWLNHRYLMYKPKVWIGNEFEMYEDAVSGGGEVEVMLNEARKLRREEGYVKLEWPEQEWGGKAVFNNLVVYVRRGKAFGGDATEKVGK